MSNESNGQLPRALAVMERQATIAHHHWNEAVAWRDKQKAAQCGLSAVREAQERADVLEAAWRRADQARAAVAELVEAAKAPAVAFGCEGHTGVHFVSGERDECVEESRRDGSRVVELIVRPATALARMGEQA